MLTKESLAHPNTKKAMVQATETDTTIIQRSIGTQTRVLRNKPAEKVLEMEDRLKSEKGEISPTARKDMMDKISKERKELMRLKVDLEKELKQKDEELKRELLTEIREIIKTFSEREKQLILLEKKSVVVIDDNVDVTDKIIELYDAQKEGTL